MNSSFNTELVMRQLREEIQEKEVYKEQLSYMTSYYSKIIKKLEKEKKIVIFGCGVYGRILFENMCAIGMNNIKCFCDNNRNIVGSEYKGCKVYSPQEASTKFANACFVITPIGYENEILLQLLDMKIEIKKILIVNMLFTGLVDL